MIEPTWLPRIATCDEVYFLREDGGLEEADDDIYLALTAKNGGRYRLQLSPDAWSSLNELLAIALQSADSPLRSPDKGN